MARFAPTYESFERQLLPNYKRNEEMNKQFEHAGDNTAVRLADGFFAKLILS